MELDGPLGDRQGARHLLGRLPRGDQAQHLALAPAQDGAPARAAHPVQHFRRDPRLQVRAPAVDGADRAGDLLRRRAFEQIPFGPGPQRAEDALVGVVGGEDDDAAGGARLGQAGDRGHPILIAEFQVEQHDVGVEAPDQRHRLVGRSGRPHHRKVRLVLQDRHEPLPDDRVIVDDEHADHTPAPPSAGCPISSGSGTVARTVVPRPGRLSSRRLPPSSRARSRIPRMP